MKKTLSIAILFLLFCGSFFSSASATTPAKIVSGIVSNTASALFRWLWSLKPPTKIGMAISSRSMMKFEGGYTVETVFDGSKLGIEPYSVEVTPSGELLVLDSHNSNIHKVSTPLSTYSRPRLVAGSSEGYYGHVDGKPREARMNHPKGFTVDDRGNIYVADTMNMAIRKISETGVVTIAGGNWAQGTGHIDGPGDNAKFSNDFDVIYMASSCSLLVIDRGNQAIREIQLHDDDCSFSLYDGDHLGIVVLGAAVFCGFMLALLQRRLSAMFSSPSEPRSTMTRAPSAAHQRPFKSLRPPLIPPNDDQEKEDDGVFTSLGKLFTNTAPSMFEIFGGLFSSSKKNPIHPNQTNYHQQTPTWPMQESYAIPYENAPQNVDNFTRNSSPFMTQTDRYVQQQLQKHHHHHHQQQHRKKHHSSGHQAHYKENNEVVFGAVQEEDGKRGAVVIKAVDYGNPSYGNHDLRARYNYMGYAYGMY